MKKIGSESFNMSLNLKIVDDQEDNLDLPEDLKNQL